MAENRLDITDEMLTAYLDGAASAEDVARIEAALDTDVGLKARLDALVVPLNALRDAYDLSALDAPEIPAHLTKIPEEPRIGLAWPAAVAASFLLGVAVMGVFRPASQEAQGWVEAVASYQALYVTDTLSGPEQPPEVTTDVLSRASALLGVALTPAPQIEGLTFKRAQMLAIEGEPLVQIAYLDVDGVPFALCLTARPDPNSALHTEMSHALATTSWVEDGVGYVLVGGTNEARVTRLSEAVRDRLS